MGAAVERLTDLVASPERFAIADAELRYAHTEAMYARFQECRDKIKLHRHRAGEGNISEIRRGTTWFRCCSRTPQELPGELLDGAEVGSPGQVARDDLHVPIDPIETDDIDVWIDRLEAKGHYISCTSGTTGKSAMLIASARDIEWSRTETAEMFSWGSGGEARA